MDDLTSLLLYNVIRFEEKVNPKLQMERRTQDCQ